MVPWVLAMSAQPGLRSFVEPPLLLIANGDSRPWFPPDPEGLGESASWIVMDDRVWGTFLLTRGNDDFELAIVRDGSATKTGFAVSTNAAFGARIAGNRLLLSVNTVEITEYEDDGELIEDETTTGHLWEVDLATSKVREVIDASEWNANGEAVTVLRSGDIVWQVGDETLVFDVERFDLRATIPFDGGVAAGDLVAVASKSDHWPIRTWILHAAANAGGSMSFRVVAACADTAAQDWYSRDGMLATNNGDSCLCIKVLEGSAHAIAALEAYPAERLPDVLDELAASSAA